MYRAKKKKKTKNNLSTFSPIDARNTERFRLHKTSVGINNLYNIKSLQTVNARGV